MLRQPFRCMVAVARGKTKCFHSTHVWVAGPVGVLAGLGAGGLFVGGLACGRARRAWWRCGGVVAALRGVVARWFGVALCCVGVSVVLLLLLLCPFSRLSWSALRVVSLPCLPCLLLLGLMRLAFVLGVFLVGFRSPGSVSDFGFLGFAEFKNSFSL